MFFVYRERYDHGKDCRAHNSTPLRVRAPKSQKGEEGMRSVRGVPKVERGAEGWLRCFWNNNRLTSLAFKLENIN